MRKKHTFLFRVVTYLVGFKVIKNHQTLRLTCLAFQMADEWSGHVRRRQLMMLTFRCQISGCEWYYHPFTRRYRLRYLLRQIT